MSRNTVTDSNGFYAFLFAPCDEKFVVTTNAQTPPAGIGAAAVAPGGATETTEGIPVTLDATTHMSDGNDFVDGIPKPSSGRRIVL